MIAGEGSVPAPPLQPLDLGLGRLPAIGEGRALARRHRGLDCSGVTVAHAVAHLIISSREAL
jgi:hypothetical protein